MRLFRNLLACLAVFSLALPSAAQIGLGLGIPQVAGRMVSFGFSPPLTTFPVTGADVLDINPDSLSGTFANGANVTSFTDDTATATCTGTTGTYLTYATNVANGHAALHSTTPNQYANCGRPAALAAAMTDPHAFTIILVFKSPAGLDSRYNVIFGDFLGRVSGHGFSLGASLSGIHENAPTLLRSLSAGDGSANVHTLIYSGDAGAGSSGGFIGRVFLDGTMARGFYPLSIGPNSDPLFVGSALEATGGATPATTRGFVGDILRIRVLNTALSAPKVWQADAWARATYGKALATVGLSYFALFDGDSQTQGTGATPDTAMPVLVANSLGLKNGQFANVGKPSAVVASGGSGNGLIDSAARDVDGFHTVTGLPIVLIVGEYYNQGTSGGTTATGDALAANNRLYAQLRKAADPSVHIVMWTSLASYNRQGTARDQFNLDLVTAPGPYIDAVIPVHTDPNIGVDGALGTTTSGSTVSSDGIHLNSTGTPYHAALVTPFVHR